MYKYIVLTLIILLVTIYTPTVDSAYRESIPIPVKGNLYILDLDMNITSIDDYSVVAIYFKPTGGYGYGFIVMKDPDENNPRVYLIVGNQSSWYDAGLLNNTEVKFRVAIDYNSSKIVFLFNNATKSFIQSFIPRVESLYLSLFSIKSRVADYPEVFIKYMRVYVLNNTIDQIDINKENIEEQVSVKPIVDSRRVRLPPVETHTQTEGEGSFLETPELINIELFIVFIIILIAVVVAILLLLFYKIIK